MSVKRHNQTEVGFKTRTSQFWVLHSKTGPVTSKKNFHRNGYSVSDKVRHKPDFHTTDRQYMYLDT